MSAAFEGSVGGTEVSDSQADEESAMAETIPVVLSRNACQRVWRNGLAQGLLAIALAGVLAAVYLFLRHSLDSSFGNSPPS